jgi:hypothetical protein
MHDNLITALDDSSAGSLSVKAYDMSKLLNFVLFQISWFACVFGAVHGFPLLGPLLVAGTSALSLRHARSRSGRLLFLVLVGFFGTLGDLLPLHLGAFSFSSGSDLPWGYPLWMSALWVSFGTTLHSSMAWLAGRYAVASILGFIGGPLAYYGGQSLGAIALGSNAAASLLAIGVFWGLITPLLVYLSLRFSRSCGSL